MKFEPSTLRSLIAVMLATGVMATSCHGAKTIQKVDPPGAQVSVAALWINPADISKRDVFAGPGGKQGAPTDTTFRYKEGESMLSYGYDVTDSKGLEWSVKLGEEAQAEVAVSRLLWAIGYHQPALYYVPKWNLVGRHDGPQPGGRFRPEPKTQDVVDVWSWYENPFVGTREFSGLIVANILVNNWDLKPMNNKIYEFKEPVNGQKRVYVVRDLGATLGKTRHPLKNYWWLWDKGSPQGTKGRVADFESQPFIEGVDGDRPIFGSRGRHQKLFDTLTVADVRWTCELLNRLSKQQMLDAFRAAAFEPAVAERYVQMIRAKVDQGLKLSASSTRNTGRTR
jgi:hypothetical protein